MANWVEKMDTCDTCCMYYFYGMESKLNSLICSIEQIINDSYDFKDYVDAIDLLFMQNNEIYKKFVSEFSKLFESINERTAKDHVRIAELTLQNPKYYNDERVKNYLKEQTDFEIKAIKEIHELFQSVAAYYKNLCDNNSDRLYAYWKEKMDVEIKETVKMMNDFYCDKFNEIKTINDKITNKLNNSKR